MPSAAVGPRCGRRGRWRTGAGSVSSSGRAMAVVVQALLPARVAGVMFTANPSTGARDELLINASFGLGEAIVSGQVTPDTFVIARAGLTVRSTTLGSKQLMIVSDGAAGDGIATVPV